jgi:sigma-B regulation protein RsbU (phosphoserine phosphatase)
MSENEVKNLKSKILELEKEIEIKDQELDRSHKQLFKVNSQLEKMIQEMNQELSVAHAIQKYLSPTELPNIPGFELSSKFVPGVRYGGDYFDIFEHEDKLKFGILLSCSSGYAMSALFLSVLIKLSTQIEARKGKDPHLVIDLINQELQPNVQANDQASLFYAVVDRRNFEMTYSLVGSSSVFLQSMKNEKILSLQPSTGPIKKGYSGGAISQKIPLESKDRLIICSEGVGPGEEIKKIINRAPRSGVHELRNEIFYQLGKQNKNVEPLRDQTVIVTEVKERVIKLANN